MLYPVTLRCTKNSPYNLGVLLLLKQSYCLLFQLTEEFEEVPVQSRGFGILDVGYRSKVIHSL